MAPRTTLVLGGARSGKSRRAQALAESFGPRRLFVATAEAFDAEMRERIARHRGERDASWRTVEAPLALPEALDAANALAGGHGAESGAGGGAGGGAEGGSEGGSEGGEAAVDVILVDCLTLWLSNLVLGEHALEAPSERLLAALGRTAVPVVLVSNEVGSGLVPETPLGRRFRDDQGRLNQRVAQVCERVELVVAGLPLTIRGAPAAL